jgi:hypothetical protein
MALIVDAICKTRPSLVREDDNPRESMRVLPEWLQLPLTLLTGKPYYGQRAPRLRPTHHLIAAFASIAIGVAVSSAALAAGGWWLFALVPGWAITLHGLRNLRMMIYHQCAHRNMYARHRPDAAIGQLSSSLLLVQNFRRYSEEHVSDHHAVHHMTLRDPTVQAMLLSLDLHPGMTVRQMWRRLLGKLVSPRFHAAFAVARVRSFAHGSYPAERACAVSLYGAAIAAAILSGHWLTFVVAWLVPLFPMFQVSNTLRLCVKHTFPRPGAGARSGKAYFTGLTNAIFLGERVPRRGRGALAWLRWTARMAFLHYPARYLVLTGDTVCHDFHHRRPRARDWADYIFARQQDIERGHPGWPPYREAWGLGPAISRVFGSLAVADPDEFDARQIRSVSKRELFSAFDD